MKVKGKSTTKRGKGAARKPARKPTTMKARPRTSRPKVQKEPAMVSKKTTPKASRQPEPPQARSTVRVGEIIAESTGPIEAIATFGSAGGAVATSGTRRVQTLPPLILPPKSDLVNVPGYGFIGLGDARALGFYDPDDL